jgi:hypothetical protein
MDCETNVKVRRVDVFCTNVGMIDLRKWTVNLTVTCPDLNLNTILPEHSVEMIIKPVHKDQAIPCSVHDLCYASK